MKKLLIIFLLLTSARFALANEYWWSKQGAAAAGDDQLTSKIIEVLEGHNTGDIESTKKALKTQEIQSLIIQVLSTIKLPANDIYQSLFQGFLLQGMHDIQNEIIAIRIKNPIMTREEEIALIPELVKNMIAKIKSTAQPLAPKPEDKIDASWLQEETIYQIGVGILVVVLIVMGIAMVASASKCNSGNTQKQ